MKTAKEKAEEKYRLLLLESSKNLNLNTKKDISLQEEHSKYINKFKEEEKNEKCTDKL